MFLCIYYPAHLVPCTFSTLRIWNFGHLEPCTFTIFVLLDLASNPFWLGLSNIVPCAFRNLRINFLVLFALVFIPLHLGPPNFVCRVTIVFLGGGYLTHPAHLVPCAFSTLHIWNFGHLEPCTFTISVLLDLVSIPSWLGLSNLVPCAFRTLRINFLVLFALVGT